MQKIIDNDNYLLCANCVSNLTHIKEVRVSSNIRKNKIETYNGETIISNIGGSNGSDDWIRIYSWCEDCPYISILEIRHHEGNTFLENNVEKNGINKGIQE